MRLERALAVVSTALVAVQVAPQAEQLWQRWREFEQRKQDRQQQRDREFLAANSAAFHKAWSEVCSDLRRFEQEDTS